MTAEPVTPAEPPERKRGFRRFRVWLLASGALFLFFIVFPFYRTITIKTGPNSEFLLQGTFATVDVPKGSVPAPKEAFPVQAKYYSDPLQPPNWILTLRVGGLIWLAGYRELAPQSDSSN